MKSKMFRFGLSSILCIFVGVASVLAPALVSAHKGAVFVTDNLLRLEHANSPGYHTHIFFYKDGTRNLAGAPGEIDGDGTYFFNSDDEESPQSHSHTFTHQHGNYGSHTHTGSHSHTNTSDTHSGYTADEIHAVNNDHTDIGTQTTNNNRGNTVTVGGGTPGVGDSGTPEDTSGAQQAVSSTPQATQVTQPLSPMMQPLRVTEYMVRDWSKSSVGVGNSNLPQWIELYNPNTEAINLKGWTFQYATQQFRNSPIKIHTLMLAATEDGFSIAGGGVAILSTQSFSVRKPWGFSGIQESQVYTLNIQNVLKRGWVLTDADGTEIHRLGRDAFSALTDPVAPLHQDRARVSHQVYPSEAPSEAYYYGKPEDIGSPGFYSEAAPKAPSAVRRKRVGTWARLKWMP